MNILLGLKMKIRTKSRRFNFYATVLIANLTMIALGNAYAWTSPSLPILMSSDSVFPITQDQGSWIASLFILGAAVGPFFASSIKEAVGYKWTLFIESVLMLTSWIMLATTWSIYVFYIARFIAGISSGINYCILPLYIGEIAEDTLRSAVNSLALFFRCLAFLEEYSIGPFISYYKLLIVSSMASVLHIALTYRVPESPYHLMSRGKKEEALKTVIWLRGNIPETSASIIMTDIQAYLERTKNANTSWREFLISSNVKALFTTVALLSLQQTTGVSIMIIYTKQMFDMTGSNISSSLSSIIFGIVYIIGAMVAPLLTKRYGFKVPFIISALGIFISETILGTYLYMTYHGYNLTSFSWCPLACVLAYAITYNCGLGPLPAAVIGEIFPANIKVKASAISQSVGLMVGFIFSKNFPIMSQTLGVYVVFWIFASTSILVLIIAIYLIPDTKGLSLDKIQDAMNKSKVSNINNVETTRF